MSSFEPQTADLDAVVDQAKRAGIRRITVLAYRDLDDHAAGGSELHAHEVMARWAEAGLEVYERTVTAPGRPEIETRSGYQIRRAGGRSLGVPRIAFEGATRRLPKADALVEIWNGVPFFSPFWWRGPRLVVLHHLHDKLWEAFYPAPFDRIGSTVERRLAPLAYRTSPVATLAPSGRDDLIARTPLKAAQIHVVKPGIDNFFRTDTFDDNRSTTPLLLSVGRLTTAKRVRLAIDVLHNLSDEFPTLKLVIVGEGPQREALVAKAASLGVSDQVELVGRASREDLALWYQRAWLILGTSISEGWGMTLTEAAAAGTPSVASDIVGHRDAMAPGSGLLASDDLEFEANVRKMLADASFRAAAGQMAHSSSKALSWDTTATGLLKLLVADADRLQRKR